MKQFKLGLTYRFNKKMVLEPVKFDNKWKLKKKLSLSHMFELKLTINRLIISEH